MSNLTTLLEFTFACWFLLTVKHLIVDFYWQTPYQFLNKGTYLHPGGILHAGLHAITTGVILMFLYASLFGKGLYIAEAWMLAGIEFLVHYHMDWFKMWWNEKRGYRCDNSAKFWHWLGIDQFVHTLNYWAIAYASVYMIVGMSL